MSVYRCEVTYEMADYTGPAAAANVDDTIAVRLFFVVRDDANFFGLRSQFALSSYGGRPTYEYRGEFVPIMFHRNGIDDSDKPWTWDGLQTNPVSADFVRFQETDGANAAGWKTGGTLAIEKDTATNNVSFITPLGTHILLPTDVDWTFGFPPISPNATAMIGIKFAHELARGVNVVPTASETARWKHFFSFQDGVETAGAELSAADPGLFTSASTVIVNGGGDFTVDDAQLTLSFETGQTFDNALQAHDVIHEHTINNSTGPGAIDVCRAREHALVFEAAIRDASRYRVDWRKSHDGGRVWRMGLIYMAMGSTFSSPSITYHKGTVRAVWGDGTAIYQATSVTAAEEWSVPITLVYTGSFPRHILHPEHGITLYFFFNSGDLKVARSADNGSTFIDASPITVVSPLAAQQLDAEFAFDGSVIVTYFDAGAWQQMRSYTMGLTWG